MRDLDLGDDLIVLGDDPEHVDRPAFRVLTVDRDEVAPAGNTLAARWPVDDRVLGDKLAYADPVPVLDPVPQCPHHFGRFRWLHEVHHPTVPGRRQNQCRVWLNAPLPNARTLFGLTEKTKASPAR